MPFGPMSSLGISAVLAASAPSLAERARALPAIIVVKAAMPVVN